MLKSIICLLCLFPVLALIAGEPPSDRASIFSIPGPEELPFVVKTISKVEKDDYVLSELYINGPPLNSKPTKIYAWYACPKGKTGLPAVIHLHGAGLMELSSKSAVEYAKNGFACLSIDWAGSGKNERDTLRSPPYSEFESSGGMVQKRGGEWHTVPVADNRIVNGVRFVRRGFDFLSSLPEIDSNKICLSGMSAGAHLSLLVLGVDQRFRAAAVKYGSAFIKELNRSGFFSPVSLAPESEYDEWLFLFDPKHGLKKIRTPTLMLSGTDDIFFFMPAVLAAWRAILAPKRLLMRPNDSHQWVNNEEVPREWFNFIIKGAPQWPSVASIQANQTNDSLEVSVSTSDVSEVTIWYKQMKRSSFTPRREKNQDTPAKWNPVTAKKGDANKWEATLGLPSPDEQIVLYANVQGDNGVVASSDTVEFPAYPKWRLPAKK